MWTQVYDPLGSWPLSTLMAALPAAEARIERVGPAMPALTTLAERMGMQGVGAQLMEDAPLFGVRRKRSEPGRLPMVTVLADLTEPQLVSILTETRNALTKQYAKLMAMEGVELEFSEDALKELAG